MTQQDVASSLAFSVSKMIRLESGFSTISTSDLMALTTLYEVPQEQFEEVLALTRRSRSRSSRWTWRYRELLDPDLETYLAFEGYASEVFTFDPKLISKLLQTRDYTSSCISTLSESDRSMVIELTQQRQARIFNKAAPPRLRFILDESVIHRSVGGKKVMQEQIEHLGEMAQRPGIEILVVPFSVGAYAGLGSPFELLTLPEEEETTVGFTRGFRPELIEDSHEVDELTRVFNMLETSAVAFEAFLSSGKQILSKS